jgi:hypothetical protein
MPRRKQANKRDMLGLRRGKGERRMIKDLFVFTSVVVYMSIHTRPGIPCISAVPQISLKIISQSVSAVEQAFCSLTHVVSIRHSDMLIPIKVWINGNGNEIIRETKQ